MCNIPPRSFTIERHGNAWKLTEPQKQDIPQRWKVDHVLYELSTLEYANIVADSPDDRSRYGLDAPQVQITMWQQDGSTIGPLVVGYNHRYCRAGNQDGLCPGWTPSAALCPQSGFFAVACRKRQMS